MWKILSVIAFVLLLAAAYFSYENHKTTDQMMKDLASEKQSLESRQNQLADVNEEIAALNQSIMMLRDEKERLTTEKIDLDNKLLQTQAEQKQLETQVAAAEGELDRLKKVVEGVDEIESVRKEMVEVRAMIEDSEIQKTEKEGAIASNQVQRDNFEKVANELVALRQDQDNGIIRGEFQSTISKAYNNWGFVVVNGGNDQGVVHKAQLDVYRRGQFVCKLLVTSVEANQSIADIVPGSLQPGQSVIPGDMVVKAIRASTPVAPVSTTPVGPAPTASGGGNTTAPPQPGPTAPAAPMEANPFGEGAAPPAAPAELDPFSGGAMDGGGGAAPPATTEPDPFQ